MRNSRRRAAPVKQLILFILMVPLALFVLIRAADPGTTVRESGSAVVVTLAPETEKAPVPTSEVIWEYPEGYVDLSDLPDVDLSTWPFTLVNALDKENYLRESFTPPATATVEGFIVREGVEGPLQELLTAARNEGFILNISRAYMSYYEISYKFNGTASGLADGKKLSYSDAVEKAKKVAHYPGTDEHQLGVAVNFIDGEGNWQISSPAIQWVGDHCHEYGFILRYPIGKSDKTGWEYTPNQFRYVGKEAAKYIMEKGITLEEFLQAYKDAKEWEMR